MLATVKRSSAQWVSLRKIGGYGAAVAVTPYLVIKVAWTFGLVLPNAEMGEPTWRAINATTAVLALGGILLGLAFSQPWGERLPAWIVLLPVWVGTGLLVPMVLLAPVLAPAAVTTDRATGASTTWSIEQIFVVVSLVGVGLGLPIAFAGYVLARWPQALRGSLDYEEPPAHTRNLQRTLGHMAAVGCTLLGLVKLFWALGATAGLDPAGLAERDLWWHMLTLSTGAWALAGAWSMLALTTRRGGTRFRPPMIVAWVSSGMLFSYNVFAAMRGDFQASPEHPLARALTTQAGIVLGVLMLLIVLLVVHDRRTRASARRWVSARIGNG